LIVDVDENRSDRHTYEAFSAVQAGAQPVSQPPAPDLGFATLGTIGFEGRFDYAAIGTASNVASRLCDEAKPGQILISPRVRTKVEHTVKVEPVGEFELKGIGRPLAAYNVLAAQSSET
jgi:class 3 adenylate cyclase